MTDPPRAYTEDEVRDEFLDHVYGLTRYWAGLDGSNVPESYSLLEKLDGLAFSILAALDGSSMAVPAFRVSPSPHPDDKEFHIAEGSNYYDEDVDIGGCLHELMKRGKNG